MEENIEPMVYWEKWENCLDLVELRELWWNWFFLKEGIKWDKYILHSNFKDNFD